MVRVSFWFVASLFLAASQTLGATVIEKTILVTVEPDGLVKQSHTLRVRLEDPDDYDRWSPYAIHMDENRKLKSIEAAAVTPDGKRHKVKRKNRDTMEYAGPDNLHSSDAFKVITFPGGLDVGSVLELKYELESRPYFPARTIRLAESETVEKLRVDVKFAAQGSRWKIIGSTKGLSVRETGSGITVEASNFSRVLENELNPDEIADGPNLVFAWGEESDWKGVGQWCERLWNEVPRFPESVRSEAKSLADSQDNPREKLEALLAFARKRIRYVSVQVGIGGYRPSPPAEVMERKWGDCKDKSLLLIDLLKEVGIESYPALIRSSFKGDIDPEFPSPFGFNHVIVAVPTSAVEAHEADPVSEGLFFVDPTQTKGNAAYLNSSVQGKRALVVKRNESRLVRTPVRSDLESQRTEFDIQLDSQRDATGTVVVTITGGKAAAYIYRLESRQDGDTDADVLSALSSYLPSNSLKNLAWVEISGDVPSLKLTASVTLEGLMGGNTDRPYIRLPGETAAPSLRLLEDVTGAVALRPSVRETVWRITMPWQGCVRDGEDVREECETAEFVQSVDASGSTITVTRRLSLNAPRVEPESVPSLSQVAQTEIRTLKRRIRLNCGS